MAKTSRLSTEESPTHFAKAFLVVRRGGRWTDLLRLSPERSAVIGRSSANQVVIRSHQASRQHAEVRWDDGQWWVRDLGSRNGTSVDGTRIDLAKALCEGNRIEVAGCEMTFVTRVSDAFAMSQQGISRGTNADSLQHSDEQLTMDGTDTITHRATRSRLLPNDELDISRPHPKASDPWQELFQLAFQLASAESVEDAAQLTLAMLTTLTNSSAGAIYLPTRSTGATTESSAGDSTTPALIAFTCSDDRSYRAPATTIVESVVRSGTAVIARNIIDDIELQDADSRGELSTTTAIVAPIVLKRLHNRVGYLHLYSTNIAADYSADELDLAIAASGVFAAAVENLRTRVQLTRSLRNSRKQIEQLRERIQDSVQIIGNSVAIRNVKSLIARVARANSTVLIRGESGVGKELVAAAIHQSSSRRDAPMVCLNCAALSSTLLESELFGHEKGAFTGATEQKKGKFESADGGTLMLDEIGEMHFDLQAKLLRVLEGHPFERLGGQQPIRVDVRMIAATNRDLQREVHEGRFRSDLYFRLNVVEIVVPPLRERREDIIPIADHYLTYFSDKMARRVDGFTKRANEALETHSWPGNIRELKNVIERAVVLGCDEMVDAQDLSIVLPETSPVSDSNFQSGSIETTDAVVPMPTAKLPTLNDVEQQHLIAVLKEVGGNKSRAAIALGIERSTLDRKLKRFDIQPSSYKSS